jgi:hypothetical protein
LTARLAKRSHVRNKVGLSSQFLSRDVAHFCEVGQASLRDQVNRAVDDVEEDIPTVPTQGNARLPTIERFGR